MDKIYLVINKDNNAGGTLTYREWSEIVKCFSKREDAENFARNHCHHLGGIIIGEIIVEDAFIE